MELRAVHMRLQRHQRQTLSRLEKEINYTCIHDLMALDALDALDADAKTCSFLNRSGSADAIVGS